MDKKQLKRKLWTILESNKKNDPDKKKFETFIETLVLLNVIAVILESFDDIEAKYYWFFEIFETFTVIVFSAELLLRFWVSELRFRGKNRFVSYLRFLFTPMALIDIAAIIPFFIQPVGDFDLRHIRILRLARLLRVFKLNRYNNSLKLIIKIFSEKRKELGATVFLTFSVVVTASTLMFYIEKEVQPEVFPNILNAFWWAIATLTTVGYGDVYPVTAVGKILGSIIAMMGIIIVAIPTGIISSSFVQKMDAEADRRRINYIKNLLKKAFYKKYIPPLACKVRRGGISVEAIKINLELNEQDLYKVAEGKNEFRFRLKKVMQNGIMTDKIYLEYNDINTTYGTLKNKKDTLSIVSTESLNKQSIGYFSYLLHEKLKCNIISNEFYGDETDIWDESFGDKGLELETQVNFKNNKGYLFNLDNSPADFEIWKSHLSTLADTSNTFISLYSAELPSNTLASILTLKRKNIKTKELEYGYSDDARLLRFIDSIERKSELYLNKMMAIQLNDGRFNARDNNLLIYLSEKLETETILIFINEQYIEEDKVFKSAAIFSEAIKEELEGLS